MASADRHARTEPPTPKRRKEARDRGQVARSPDVAGWGALLVGANLLPLIVSKARADLLGIMGQATQVMSHPSVPGALVVFTGGLRAAFFTILPIAATFMVLGVVANVAQVGRSFSLKAARPKLSRISPKAGFRRLFSASTSVQLGKQCAKLVILGGLAEQTIHGLLGAVPSTVPIGISQAIGLGTSRIMTFIRTISLLGLAVGLGDFAYQRHRLLTSLRMTKQEVKDEHRQAEGDPTMKGELRKKQYAIARSRILAAVRTADVVIANPTHFAVALQYELGTAGAPRVVAKGSDDLARRIREEAATCAIPVVEDPPLARYLYATCDPGTAIPQEIYVAVARLLAFVYSLPAYLRSSAPLHPSPSAVPFDLGERTAIVGRVPRKARERLLATT